MSNDTPKLITGPGQECEIRPMEYMLTVEHTEYLGNASSERRVELSGYLSTEAMKSALDMMREVVGE